MVIETTSLWPHMAITASPRVPDAVKSAVAKSILAINQHEDGSRALSKLGFSGFEPADQGTYESYSKLLAGYGRYSR